MVIRTKLLNNGVEVLAKWYKGELSALTYANRTAAERKAHELGPRWAVYHWGVPWYVGKAVQAECEGRCTTALMPGEICEECGRIAEEVI